MPRKILLLYAAPHSGHAQAAQAIADAAMEDADWVVAQDYMSGYFPLMGKLFLNFYKEIVERCPGFWGHLHDNPFYEPWAKLLERLITRWDILKVLRSIEAQSPDAVILTHAFPLRILAQARASGRSIPPLFVVITDFWAHRYWACDWVSRYFVSCSKAAEDLRNRGVKAERIVVTGLPLRRQFARGHDLKADIRRRLELEPERFTVLVLGGSYGLLPFGELLKPPEPGASSRWQWIFVFGRNAEALAEARRCLPEASRNEVRLLGFQDDIASLMRASDLLITKGGAVTAWEAMAVGLPMIIHCPLPGQEEGNVRFLTIRGAALRADHAKDVVSLASRLFYCRKELSAMSEAAKRISSTQAASVIVRELRSALGVSFANRVEPMGVEPTTSSLRRKRSPS